MSILLLVWVFVSDNLYAKESPRQIAEEEIVRHGVNFAWSEELNPTIVWEQYFYTYDDENPSYIEYKVSCDDTKDCGFVLVNIDKTDTGVPFASLNWPALSEQLIITWSSRVKYYYFGIFDIFSYDKETWEIRSWIPMDKKLEEEYKKSLMRWDSSSELLESFNRTQQKAISLKEKRIKRQLKQAEKENKAMKSNKSSVFVWNLINQGGCFSYTPCYH